MDKQTKPCFGASPTLPFKQGFVVRRKERGQGRKHTAEILSQAHPKRRTDGCFLLPTVTVCPLIGMPRDDFHTRPAGVIFSDA